MEVCDPNHFTCELCDENIFTSIEFALHSVKHSSEGFYHCTYCRFKTRMPNKLSGHQDTHREQSVTYLQCSICEDYFDDTKVFAEHKNIHDGSTPFNCELCRKAFMFSWLLRAHRRLLHPKATDHNKVEVVEEERKPFECTKCCRDLKCEKDHVQKPFECFTCGRSFSYKGNLVTHLQYHSGKTPFQCERCGCRFALKHVLKKHMETHSDVKPHVCALCGKAFRKNCHLTTHARVHTNERPFKCSMCEKSFKQDGALRSHYLSHGVKQEKKYGCLVCKQSYVLKKSLDEHTCGRRRQMYLKHRKVCQICQKSFSKNCSLVEHLRKHTGERPFMCHLCPMTFAYSSAFRSHLKRKDHMNHKEL